MLILHGSWLLTAPTDNRRGFVMWGETDFKTDMTTRALSRIHPFGASARALCRVLTE